MTRTLLAPTLLNDQRFAASFPRSFALSYPRTPTAQNDGSKEELATLDYLAKPTTGYPATSIPLRLIPLVNPADAFFEEHAGFVAQQRADLGDVGAGVLYISGTFRLILRLKTLA